MSLYLEVDKSDICNFGLLPIGIESNPVYLTTKQFIKNPDINLEETILFQYHSYFSENIKSNIKGSLDLYNLFTTKDIISDKDFAF